MGPWFEMIVRTGFVSLFDVLFTIPILGNIWLVLLFIKPRHPIFIYLWLCFSVTIQRLCVHL